MAQKKYLVAKPLSVKEMEKILKEIDSENVGGNAAAGGGEIKRTFKSQRLSTFSKISCTAFCIMGRGNCNKKYIAMAQ